MSAVRSGADLVGRRVTVDVPATTANLGAGFDALALALDLSTIIELAAVPPEATPAFHVDVRGEGAGHLPTGRRNRFISALIEGLEDAGVEASGCGWHVRMDNHIPVTRGLGSSASATVAALVAADALLDGALGPERILELAALSEGHPDNAAAAVYGGLCVVATVAGDPRAIRIEPPAGLLAALYIPDKHLSTAAMRAALPERVPFADAVHNIGAAALAVAALSEGRMDLLAAGTVDRLHEPYRAVAYPELPELVEAALAAGAQGACLSGAGPTVIAFSDDVAAAATIAAAMERRAQALGLAGRAAVQAARAEGARVIDGPDARAAGASLPLA
ncbi:MAG: homoserine kinase [Candidatus Limnocylindrales bacterium]